MVKNKKSKWKKRILVLLFTAMVLFGTGLLFVREDWRFMITQEISGRFSQHLLSGSLVFSRRITDNFY